MIYILMKGIRCDNMKAEELNSYRDNDGYIDYSKFEKEKGNLK